MWTKNVIYRLAVKIEFIYSINYIVTTCHTLLWSETPEYDYKNLKILHINTKNVIFTYTETELTSD